MTTERSTAADAAPFAALPDSARLWVFGVSRPLFGDEVERLLSEVDAFLEKWKAHGHPLAAARDWREERFLMVAVDDRITPPSGCSIDALVRILRGIEEELSIEMVGGGPLWYRDPEEGEPRRVTRSRFREMAAAGEITPETPVFDLTLTRIGELRAGGWEGPAGERFHQRFLPDSGS